MIEPIRRILSVLNPLDGISGDNVAGMGFRRAALRPSFDPRRRAWTLAILGVLGVGIVVGPLGAQCLYENEHPIAATDARGGERFGSALVGELDTLLVGAPMDNEGGPNAGAVFVFRYGSGGWVETQKLLGESGDSFGSALAMSDGVAVVGAPGSGLGAPGAGAVSVFRLEGETLASAGVVLPSNPQAGEQFGASLSLSSGSLAVGSPLSAEGGGSAGAVTIFVGSPAFVFQQRLTGRAGSRFGSSVSMISDLLLAGAPFDGEAGANSGTAFLYRRQGATWMEEQELSFFGALPGDNAGTSVALGDSVLLVGIPGRDFLEQGATDIGIVSVFRRLGGVWIESDFLLAFQGGFGGDRFGTSVALAGSVAVGGSPFDSVPFPNNGSASVFLDDGSAFQFSTRLTSSSQGPGDQFGSAVAAWGAEVACGAPLAVNGGSAGGKAAVFSGGFSGSVNGAVGISDVLRVNDSSGGGSRTVPVPLGTPLTVSLEAPPMGPAADLDYVVWVWRGVVPRPFLLDVGTSTLGCTVSPTPLQPFATPQPILCLRSDSRAMGAFCGAVTDPGSPEDAPWTITRRQGIARAGFFLLQGVIEDLGSLSADGYSVTNAIILRADE